MSIPRDHHHLPVFYQKRWTNADGEVTVYRRHRSGLEIKHKPPTAIGYKRDLYAILSEADPNLRQELELKFMSVVDDLAADALAEMEATGKPPSAADHRNGWARFIMRLFNASPRRVEHFRAELKRHEDDTLREIEATYEEKRKPDEPATFAEFMKTTDKSLTDRTVAQLIRNLADSPLIGNALIRMTWAILRLKDGTYDFLTSDMPVMRSHGLGDKLGFALMPIGPRTLFMAAHRKEVLEAFAGQKTKALVRAINDAIVQQAEHMVIARDESQTAFIEKRLGRDLARTSKGGTDGDLTWKPPIELAPWA